LAAFLRQWGLAVSYVDCLDRFHPRAPAADPHARFGRGPYFKTPIAKPAGLAHVPRTYSRYGIRPRWLMEDLARLPDPDLVLVTSMMTYWYPGVRETIARLKERFPRTPVVLGGVYATLCRDHARSHCGADRVVAGPAEKRLPEIVAEATGCRITEVPDTEDLDSYPFPSLDLQRRIPFVPLLTTRGCPFSCPYCASAVLEPRMRRRSAVSVMEEIGYWHHKFGVRDFVFYDDALLVDAPHHALPLFESIARSGMQLRFHTPNAVHVREISPAVACLMRRIGFETLRLGVETADFGSSRRLDRKLGREDFFRAVRHLRAAGFAGRQVGAYLLAGLPGQTWQEVARSIESVRASGITPVIAHYTPIPHTALWEEARQSSRYDLAADPVFTNNAITPCQHTEFSWEELSRLKALAGR
jgi:radical SAM superfamily enzyme YgiQ (UPF0313 family)